MRRELKSGNLHGSFLILSDYDGCLKLQLKIYSRFLWYFIFIFTFISFTTYLKLNKNSTVSLLERDCSNEQNLPWKYGVEQQSVTVARVSNSRRHPVATGFFFKVEFWRKCKGRWEIFTGGTTVTAPSRERVEIKNTLYILHNNLCLTSDKKYKIK